MTEKVPMTAEGHAAIEAELRYLRTVERQRIIKAIAEPGHMGISRKTPSITPRKKRRA